MVNQNKKKRIRATSKDPPFPVDYVQKNKK